MAREISISFALNAALGAGFKTVFQSASQSARNVASAIREMEKSPVGNLGAAMASQRDKIKGLAGSVKEAKATLAGLQAQASQASAPFLALNVKFEQGKERVKGLAGSLKTARSDLDNLKKQALASAASMNSLKAQIAEARGKVGELSAGLKEEKNALTALRAQKKAVGDSTGVLSVQIAQAESRIASLSSKLGAAKTSLAGLQGKEQAAAAATNALKAQAISAKDAVAKLSASLKEEKNSLAALKSQVSNAARSMDDLKSEVAQAENRVKSLSGTLATQVASWRENAAQATAVSGSVHKLAGEYERLSQKMERARKVHAAQAANRAHGDALRSQRADLNSRLTGAMASAATVAAPVALSIGFEDQMAKVGAVSRASKEDLAALTEQARQLGRDTSFSASQAAEGMQYLAMAGFKTNQTMAAMPGMLDLAAASGTDLGTTANIASNILSAFELKAEEMGHVGDVLVAAFTSSNTTLQSLGDTMKYVGPVAKDAGASIEDAVAMAGMLGNVGIDGSMAGTAAKSIFARLAAPPTEAAKALNALNIKTKDAQGNLRAVPDLLEEITLKTASMGTADRTDVFSKVFGLEPMAGASALAKKAAETVDENGNQIVDSMGKPTTALLKFVDELKHASDEVDGVKGVSRRVAAQMNATTGGSLRMLKSAWEDAGISVGNLFLPAIRTVAGALSNIANAISGFTERFPNLSKYLALSVGGFLALTAGGVALGLMVNLVKTGINGLAGGFLRMAAGAVAATTSSGGASGSLGLFGLAAKAAGAAARFFAGGLRSILVATGVGALLVGLGFAINLLIDNWDAVVAAMSAAWGWVTDTWGRLGVFFSTLGNNLGAVFSDWGQTITGWVKPAWDIVTSVWNGVTTYYSWLFGGIATIATTVWGTIAGLITSPVETVKNAWNTITGFFSGLWGGIISIAASAVNGVCGVWSGATAFFGAITQGISALFAWASSAVTTVWEGMVEFFGYVGQGISDCFSGVWQGIVDLAAWAWEGIAGIWTGASEFFAGIVDSIFGVFTSLFDWLREKFAWVFSAIDAVSNAVGSITGAVKGAWNAAFGDKKKDNSPAQAANGEKATTAAPPAATKPLSEKPAAQKMPQMPAAAQGASENPAAGNIPKPKYQPVSADDYHAAFDEKKGGSKGKKGGGSRSKTAGGAGGGSRSGSAKDSKSGPVTVVTLDSGNEIKTQFFPAGSRTAAPNANSAASRPAAPNAGSAGGLRQTAPSGQQERGILSGAVSALKSSGIGAAIGQGLQTGIGMAKSALGLGQKSPAATPVSTIQTGKPPVLSISPDSQPVATVSATSRPALPQAPSLIAKNRKAKQEAKQTGQQAVSIDLTQNFDLITQDAAAVRKVMESLKPDFEALVRRALDKMQSDKRRTAYGQ